MNDSKQALTKELEKLLTQVPSSVINGSWNLSVRYKNWVVKVTKIIKGGRASELDLISLIRTYKSF